MKAFQYVLKEVELEVEDITLLSVEEADSISRDILIADRGWWLRSPGYSSRYAAYVDSDGSVDNLGFHVDHSRDAVRPALKIRNLESLSLVNGDKIEFAGHKWTIVCGKYALCDGIVGYTAFRVDYKAADANDYEKSDVKKWLETWVDENKIEFTKGVESA